MHDTGAGHFAYYFLRVAAKNITCPHITDIYCIMLDDNSEEFPHFVISAFLIDTLCRHAEKDIVPVQTFSGSPTM
jgi:hypothetical protein